MPYLMWQIWLFHFVLLDNKNIVMHLVAEWFGSFSVIFLILKSKRWVIRIKLKFNSHCRNREDMFENSLHKYNCRICWKLEKSVAAIYWLETDIRSRLWTVVQYWPRVVIEFWPTPVEVIHKSKLTFFSKKIKVF